MEALVQMTGHVGTEVEIRGGRHRVGLPAGLHAAGRGQGREYGDGNTTWIDVSCFRTLAAHVAASVRKGDPVIVIGKLRTSVWEKDGQTRERLVLEADDDRSRPDPGHGGVPADAAAGASDPSDEPTQPDDEVQRAGPSAEERAPAQAA